MAGEIAQEVWRAAGDPTKFPEQIREGLRPWSPLKVYARVPNFNVTKDGMYDYAIDKYVPVKFFDYVTQKWSDKRPPTTLEIQEGQPAPAAGLTYLQIAREGLGFQKTQNGGGAGAESGAAEYGLPPLWVEDSGGGEGDVVLLTESMCRWEALRGLCRDTPGRYEIPEGWAGGVDAHYGRCDEAVFGGEARRDCAAVGRGAASLEDADRPGESEWAGGAG